MGVVALRRPAGLADHEPGVMVGAPPRTINDQPDLVERERRGPGERGERRGPGERGERRGPGERGERRGPGERGGRTVRLAEIRATGLVWGASEPAGARGVERFLPLAGPLRPLIPGGGLRRGSTIVVAPGSTSLLFTLLSSASSAGSWCAAVGLPRLGLVAAAEAGVAVDRFALVPNPGPEWPSVVAALLDGIDIVVAVPPGPVAAQVAARLTARARQRGGVLVPIGGWPGADLTLEMVGGTWHGLGQGRGRVRRREVEVVASGRGAAARARRARIWLPGAPPDNFLVAFGDPPASIAPTPTSTVDAEPALRLAG